VEYLYVGVSACLLVPPVCVLLGMLKLSLIPLVRFFVRDASDCIFDKALHDLLPSSLSEKEFRRRVRVFNLFALCAELQALNLTIADQNPDAYAYVPTHWRQKMFWETARTNVRAEIFGWQERRLNFKLRDTDNELIRARQESVLSAISMIGVGTADLAAITEAEIGPSLLRRSWWSCVANVRRTRAKLASSISWKAFRDLLGLPARKVKNAWNDEGERIELGIAATKIGMFLLGWRHCPPFLFYASLYFIQGLFFPATQLLGHWSSVEGPMAKLPLTLSCGFCICLVCIALAVCRLAWYYRRGRVLIWKSQRMTLPKGFKHPQVVDIMRETCAEEARQGERTYLLRRSGLPRGVAAHIVTFLDPCVSAPAVVHQRQDATH